MCSTCDPKKKYENCICIESWKNFNSIGEWRDILVKKYIKRPSIQFTLLSEDIPRGSIIWNGFLKATDFAKAKVSTFNTKFLRENNIRTRIREKMLMMIMI